MKLIVIDSDVMDLIQDDCELAYLRAIPDLELVPSRRAREQAAASGKSYETPLSKEKDAPVPLRLNDPNRGINDEAVVMLPSEQGRDEVQLLQSSYRDCSYESQKDDMEVIASACRLWRSKQSDPSYTHFFFISGDRKCCKKAREYFTKTRIDIEVLFAKKHNARSVNGIRDVAPIVFD